MVAVGSKSIPERQSISLDLSKETEDNLNTELFSEIFSSESINNNTTSKDENKSEIDKNDLELSNHNNKIPTNIDKNPLNESNSFSEGIGRKIVKDISEIGDENKKAVVYFGNKESNEIIKSSNKTISIDDASSFISSGMVLSKNSEISNENEIVEEVDENSSQNQHGNIFLTQPNTLNNSTSKSKNKLLKSDQKNIFNSFENNISKSKKHNLEKNTKVINADKETKVINADKDKNISSYSTSSSETEEVKIVKEDHTKFKKENFTVDKQKNLSNNNKEIPSEKNTESFFKTKYLHSSNILAPQSKNNLSNQILSNNSGIEVNAANQSNNINYGSNGNQNGTHSSSTNNNYQIYNDIKETLDMSDKRWASSLVSKINRSHASKTNEIELHLSPKNLGKLKIKISVYNKTAFVKFNTENAATSSLILNEEHKLSEMLKEVGLELEDFSSENSFNQSFSNREQGKKEIKFKSTDTNNSNDINDHENYTKDESLLNIKV